jgi:hypothetical protein
MAYLSGYLGGYLDAVRTYYLPVVYGARDPKLVPEEPRPRVLANYWDIDKQDLWGRTKAQRTPLVFVLVDGTWVSRERLTSQDRRLRRAWVGGGYESLVTAEDLADMVADGVLTQEQADNAEEVPQ